jgi:hypothetical protein
LRGALVRYWIGTIEGGHESEVTVVRERFREVKRPEWISSRLIAGVFLVYLRQSWMRNTIKAHEILASAPLLAALGRVAFLAGCVLIVSWMVALKRGACRNNVLKLSLPLDDTLSMGPPDAYMRTAKMSAIVCASAGMLYGLAGVQPSEPAQTLLSAIPMLAVVMWLERAVNRASGGVIIDLGWFLWNGWIIAIPWYAWKTGRRSGWRVMVVLLALILSPYLGAVLGWLAALPIRHLN